MKRFRIPNDWAPRKYQMGLWSYLENGGKRAVAVHHRRAGKDEVALHWTAVSSVVAPGNYWHMLPEFSHGRRALWEAINPHTGKRRIDEAFPPEYRDGKPNDTEMRIRTRSGATWHIVGSDNYDTLVGSPPRGVVFSEWALADPGAWAYIEPILEENNGWALFIFTPRGQNHGKTMYDYAKKAPSWYSELLTVQDTDVFNHDQLDTIREGLVSIYGDTEGTALFEQEYFCSFSGLTPGAYYARQLAEARGEGRITSVPHQAGAEVDTFWDLGVDDSMSIWFVQHVGKAHHVIDYYENSGYGLEHYAGVLKERRYVYGNHHLPHDVNQREMTTGEIAKSRKEVAEALGIRPILVVPRPKNMDEIMNVGIPAVRNMIPLCWFDEKKCSRGISALEGYRSEWDETKKRLGVRPVHDWCSHGADAFRTFAVGYRPRAKSRPIQIQAQGWMS